MSFPKNIAPDETLVRIIRTPQFYSKDRLRPNALRPQRGSDRVSVVRWAYREQPNEAFKVRCQKIGSTGQNSYCGLGVLSASACLDVGGLNLEDDRDAFEGHANIVYPFVVKDSEPQEGEAFKTQAELANRVLGVTRFVPDPRPDAVEWTIQSDLLP